MPPVKPPDDQLDAGGGQWCGHHPLPCDVMPGCEAAAQQTTMRRDRENKQTMIFGQWRGNWTNKQLGSDQQAWENYSEFLLRDSLVIMRC